MGSVSLCAIVRVSRFPLLFPRIWLFHFDAGCLFRVPRWAASDAPFNGLRVPNWLLFVVLLQIKPNKKTKGKNWGDEMKGKRKGWAQNETRQVAEDYAAQHCSDEEALNGISSCGFLHFFSWRTRKRKAICLSSFSPSTGRGLFWFFLLSVHLLKTFALRGESPYTNGGMPNGHFSNFREQITGQKEGEKIYRIVLSAHRN